MLNNVVLVGRLTKDPEFIENDNGKKRAFIVLAVNRPFKNTEGKYDTDFIKCTLWNIVAEHTMEYCKKGDVIGIKGYLKTNIYEKDGTTHYDTDVIAERVTFLSSRKDVENGRSENED